MLEYHDGTRIARAHNETDTLVDLKIAIDKVEADKDLVAKETRAFLAWCGRPRVPNYPLGRRCGLCPHEQHETQPCGAPTGEGPDYGTCVCPAPA